MAYITDTATIDDRRSACADLLTSASACWLMELPIHRRGLYEELPKGFHVLADGLERTTLPARDVPLSDYADTPFPPGQLLPVLVGTVHLEPILAKAYYRFCYEKCQFGPFWVHTGKHARVLVREGRGTEPKRSPQPGCVALRLLWWIQL